VAVEVPKSEVNEEPQNTPKALIAARKLSNYYNNRTDHPNTDELSKAEI